MNTKREIPKQILEILGIIFDTVKWTVKPTPKKLAKVKAIILFCLKNKFIALATFESLLGTLRWFA